MYKPFVWGDTRFFGDMGMVGVGVFLCAASFCNSLLHFCYNFGYTGFNRLVSATLLLSFVLFSSLTT